MKISNLTVLSKAMLLIAGLLFIGSLFVFWGLDVQAKLYSGIWFLIGILIYFAYGNRRSRKSEEK